MYQRSSRRTVAILLVTMLLFAGVSAGYTPVSAEDSGALTRLPVDCGTAYHIVVDPVNPSVIYVANQSTGIFRSADGGATWATINDGLTLVWVFCLVIDPVTPSTLYAGTYGGGIFRSADGGATWAPIDNGLTNPYVWDLAIDATNPAILYAATIGGGIFRTSDGGNTWNAASIGLGSMDVRSVAIDPIVPSIVYAGTSGAAICRSLDSGTTWASASVGIPTTFVPTIVTTQGIPGVYALTGNSGVFHSTDNGITWTEVPTGRAGCNVFDLAVDPTTPSILYVGVYNNGVWRSTDSGASWTFMGLETYHVWSVVVDPRSHTSWYAGTDGGIFRGEVVQTYTVTPHVVGYGGVDPYLHAGIPSGGSTTFTVTDLSGYGPRVSTGTLSGNTWTIDNITQDMTPTIDFSQPTLSVIPIVSGSGQVDPAQWTNIQYGDSRSFAVIPAAGYVASVSDGTLSGNNWNIYNITKDMTPMVTFNHLTFSVTPIIAGPGQVTPTQQTAVPSGGSATFTVTIPPGCQAIPMQGNLCGNTWVIDNVTENISPMLLVNYVPTGNIVHTEVYDSTNVKVDADHFENVELPWTTQWTATIQNYADASGLPIVNPIMELQSSDPPPQWTPNDMQYYHYDPFTRTALWHLPTIEESCGFTATAVTATSSARPGYRMTRAVSPAVIAPGTTVQDVQVTFTLEEALPVGTDNVMIQIGELDDVFGDTNATIRYVEGSGSCDAGGWTLGGDCQRIVWNADVGSLTLGRTYIFTQRVEVTLNADPAKRYMVKPSVMAVVGKWHEGTPYTSPQITFWSRFEPPIVAAEFFADDPVDWDIIFTTSRRIVTMKSVLLDDFGTLQSGIAGSLRLAPEKIQLKGNGLVQAFLSLPDPYTPESLVPESVRLCGLEPLKTHIAGGCLVATFTREQLRPVLPVLSEVKVTCTGTLTDGLAFKASCLASVSSGAPEQYNQEIVLVSGMSTFLWPFEVGMADDLSGALFRGLLGGRPNGELYADLATAMPDGKTGSIQLLADGSTKVTVSLRSGLRWSDGVPITADDIRFTYNIARTPFVWSDEAFWGPTSIPTVNIVNSSTVELLWHNQLLSVVLEALSFPLLPQHAFDPSLPADEYACSAFFRDPIVAGPYKVETWTDEVSLSLIPNPMFSGTAPTIRRITVLFLDAEATESALQSGSVDMVLPAPYTMRRAQYQTLLPTIEANYRAVLTPTRLVDTLLINVSCPLLGPSDSTSLRKAMLLAIDGQAIEGINASLDDIAVGNVSGDITSRSSIEYSPNSSPVSYNPILARSILVQNGYTWRSDGQLLSPAGIPVAVVIKYPTDTEHVVMETQYLQYAWWTTLGVNVIPVITDYYELFDLKQQGYYGMSLDRIGSPNSFPIGDMFDPGAVPVAPDWIGGNVSRLLGAELQSAYDRLHAATSYSEMVAACWSVGSASVAKVPVIAIDIATIPTIVKRQLQGVFFPLAPTPYLQGSLRGPLWNVEQWRVGDPAPLAVLKEILPTGKVNQAFAAFLHASGGSGIDYSWRLISGALPPGLAMNPSGTIAGVPTKAGTYKFSVQVTDINGTTSASTITIVVQ